MNAYLNRWDMEADPASAFSRESVWFLHKRLSGETSLRTRFFTRDEGIVDALYKGGRTPKKHALLQAFTPLWVTFNVRHEWHYVQKLEVESPPLPLQGPALFSGLYVNEIIHRLLKPLDPAPDLFTDYVTTLSALAVAPDRLAIEPILRQFERALLSAVGYEVSLTHEAISGALIDPSARYQLKVGVGFVAAKEGHSGAHLRAFAENDWNASPAVLTTAKSIMRKAIAHALNGEPIQSRIFYPKSEPVPV